MQLQLLFREINAIPKRLCEFFVNTMTFREF